MFSIFYQINTLKINIYITWGTETSDVYFRVIRTPNLKFFVSVKLIQRRRLIIPNTIFGNLATSVPMFHYGYVVGDSTDQWFQYIFFQLMPNLK